MTLGLYRNTVVGETLKATLDEMITKNLVSRSEYDKIFEKFDQVIYFAEKNHNIVR